MTNCQGCIHHKNAQCTVGLCAIERCRFLAQGVGPKMLPQWARVLTPAKKG